MLIVRTRQLSELGDIAKRYKTLSQRLEEAKKTFADSQMTFEQVTSQLDKIVRDSIGSDKYDLNKGKATKVGLDYDRQEFTVKIKSLSLQQIVALLHKLEQGDTPLFLGKVDLAKSPSDSSLSATLEIFSIKKS
jgi:exonuclease VII small subunit